MDNELIKEIALQVVNQSIIYNWKLYALIIALLLVSFSAKSFLKSYFRKRGEQLARKSDIDAIINEIKKTTESVESIKNSIEADTWIKKEFNILKRQKLEELLMLLYKYKEESHKEVKESIIGNHEFFRETSVDRITAIHKLYFPELDEVMGEFYSAFSAANSWKADALQHKINEKTERIINAASKSDHMKLYSDIIGKIISTIGAVEDKAKFIMNDLRRI